VPAMVFGSMPNDGGHLLLSDAEKLELLEQEPGAEPWLRPFLGSEEFINNIARWCLWLKDIEPKALRELSQVTARIGRVKTHRLASSREATRKLAETPRLFAEDRQPGGWFLAVPKTSSERRNYIPIGFLSPQSVASTELFTVPHATLAHFGILTSTMHMAWVRYVCGRLKSDYRYSAGIVYNNFPWPSVVTILPTSTSGAAHGHCDLRYAGTHRSPEEIRAVGTAVRGDCAGDSQGSGQAGDGGHSGKPSCATESRSAGAEMDDGRRDRGKRHSRPDQAARAVTTSALKTAIETAAQAVLDARAAHFSNSAGSSLADLYDPNAMPDDLRRAHKALDRAVDAAYQADGGKKTWADDAERVAFLFQRYAALTSLLGGAAP